MTYRMPCHARGHLHSLTCDLPDAMPHQGSLTLIPREAEDFPRGDNHSKHVPLPTYLAWLQPINCNSRFVYIHVNIGKLLLVVKTLIKNIEQQPLKLLPQKIHQDSFFIKWDFMKWTFSNIGINNEFSKCFFVLM